MCGERRSVLAMTRIPHRPSPVRAGRTPYACTQALGSQASSCSVRIVVAGQGPAKPTSSGCTPPSRCSHACVARLPAAARRPHPSASRRPDVLFVSLPGVGLSEEGWTADNPLIGGAAHKAALGKLWYAGRDESWYIVDARSHRRLLHSASLFVASDEGSHTPAGKAAASVCR